MSRNISFHKRQSSDFDLMHKQLQQYSIRRIAHHNRSLSFQNESLKEQIRTLEIRIDLERNRQRSIDLAQTPCLEDELKSLHNLFINSEIAFKNIEEKVIETKKQNQDLKMLINKMNNRSNLGLEGEESSLMDSSLFISERVTLGRSELSNTTTELIHFLSKEDHPDKDHQKSPRGVAMVWSHLMGLKV